MRQRSTDPDEGKLFGDESAAKAGSDPQNACADHPAVSILICTLGSRPTLERCLDSLIAQDCRRSEILLVLNGSSNQAFRNRFSRYPLQLLQEPRRGVCIARNSAIPKSQGGILVFVDDDIVAHPQWLHELLQGFADPSVACAVGRVLPQGILSKGPAGEKAYVNKRTLTTWTFGPEKGWYGAVLSGAVAGFGCNMAFRKSFLQECCAFPEDLGAGAMIGADDESYMFLQVVQHGFRIYHTSSAVVTHLFEADEAQQKARLQESRAATIAFHLKLLMEEKGHRWETLQSLLAGGGRFLRGTVEQWVSSEALELLSPLERFSAYLRGVRIFCRAYHRKISPQQKHDSEVPSLLSNPDPRRKPPSASTTPF